MKRPPAFIKFGGFGNVDLSCEGFRVRGLGFRV